MSDTENDYFESIEDEPEVESTPKAKAKPARKKRVLTEEQRQRNIENLRKGREKALANRKKKAELKKLEKQEVEKNLDARLKALKKEYTPVPKAEAPPSNNDDDNDKVLLEELKALRNELNELKLKPKPSEPINIPKPKDDKPEPEHEHEVTRPKTPVKQPEIPKPEPPKPRLPSKPQFIPVNQMLSSMYNI